MPSSWRRILSKSFFKACYKIVALGVTFFKLSVTSMYNSLFLYVFLVIALFLEIHFQLALFQNYLDFLAND
jgi:hypothetical protein